MNEFELIEHHFRRHGVARDDVLLGIGDDAALLALAAGERLVSAQVTVSAEAADAPGEAARRLVARALARLVAADATPRWATLALTLPAADGGWLAAFAAALVTTLADRAVALVGGDTTRGPRTATLGIHGVGGHPVPRRTPCDGDLVLLLDGAGRLVAEPSPSLRRDALLLACDGRPRRAAGIVAASHGLVVAWAADAPDASPDGALLALCTPATQAGDGSRRIGALRAR